MEPSSLTTVELNDMYIDIFDAISRASIFKSNNSEINEPQIDIVDENGNFVIIVKRYYR